MICFVNPCITLQNFLERCKQVDRNEPTIKNIEKNALKNNEHQKNQSLRAPAAHTTQLEKTFFHYFPNIFGTFSSYFPDIFRTFSEYFPDIFRTFQVNFYSKSNPNLFQIRSYNNGHGGEGPWRYFAVWSHPPHAACKDLPPLLRSRTCERRASTEFFTVRPSL